MWEIFRTTGELLVQSFGCFVIPALIWIWNWVVVFGLWLVVGGAVSLPLTISLAKKLTEPFERRSVRAVILILTVSGLWLYTHLWIASAMWWFDIRVSELSVHGWALVGILVCLWFLGSLIWWRLETKRLDPVPGGMCK